MRTYKNRTEKILCFPLLPERRIAIYVYINTEKFIFLVVCMLPACGYAVYLLTNFNLLSKNNGKLDSTKLVRRHLVLKLGILSLLNRVSREMNVTFGSEGIIFAVDVATSATFVKKHT